MKKYLAYYENEWPANIAELRAVENYPFVGYLKGEEVLYTMIPEPVVYDPWVTFTAEEASSTIGLTKLSTNQTLEYSTDTTNWNTMDTSTSITLENVDDEVYIRGILSADNTSSNYTQFSMTGKIAASGNCNAIWNYEDLETLLKTYCGHYMFHNCTSLTSAPELPATTLAERCYQCMFKGCSSLTAAPELPATTLAYGCYQSMFKGCSSLTVAPELPATTLIDYCYYGMFWDTALTAAPELPATTLETYCYYSMFSGCSSLTAAPELPATTLAYSCYNSMFYDCTSLVEAPELPATTLANLCYQYMFKGCSSLTVAPELPATTLAVRCYQSMFSGCSNLSSITCLATDISASRCTSEWVEGVSSTGIFIKHPDMNDWTTGIDSIPTGWTVVDAEV